MGEASDEATTTASGFSQPGRRITDGERLGDLRRAYACSREQLARISGVSARTIYEIEKHDRTPRRGTRRALAEVFGVSPRELFPIAELSDGGLLSAMAEERGR